MSEQMIIWNLINGQFRSLSGKVHDWVEKFYKNYDPSVSLDKSYIFHLISELTYYFENIEQELEYHG